MRGLSVDRGGHQTTHADIWQNTAAVFSLIGSWVVGDAEGDIGGVVFDAEYGHRAVAPTSAVV